MKGICGGLTGLLLLTATIVAVAVAEQAPNEEASVRATVETYLHGLKFNDVESFRKAFYPEAKLFFVRKNGELGQLTQEQIYTDYVSLLKLGDEWKIVNKVFAFEKRAS